MKKTSTIFLQGVLIVLGIGALILMLWEPRLEGRNAHATLSEIYFKDPFLAYAYVSSIPFFVALYQSFQLLIYIRQNKTFSQPSVKALRAIKYCAIILVVLISAPVAYLFIVRPGDDIAGGVAVGLAMIFISAVVATAAGLFERMLQSAVDIKSENDLTV